MSIQGTLELGRQPVNDRIIKLISMTYGANEEWLKTGAGDMLDKILEQPEVYLKHHRKKA